MFICSSSLISLGLAAVRCTEQTLQSRNKRTMDVRRSSLAQPNPSPQPITKAAAQPSPALWQPLLCRHERFCRSPQPSSAKPSPACRPQTAVFFFFCGSLFNPQRLTLRVCSSRLWQSTSTRPTDFGTCTVSFFLMPYSLLWELYTLKTASGNFVKNCPGYFLTFLEPAFFRS